MNTSTSWFLMELYPHKPVTSWNILERENIFNTLKLLPITMWPHSMHAQKGYLFQLVVSGLTWSFISLAPPRKPMGGSEFKSHLQFLSNVYCFHTIIKPKHYTSRYHYLMTIYIPTRASSSHQPDFTEHGVGEEMRNVIVYSHHRCIRHS